MRLIAVFSWIFVFCEFGVFISIRLDEALARSKAISTEPSLYTNPRSEERR